MLVPFLALAGGQGRGTRLHPILGLTQAPVGRGPVGCAGFQAASGPCFSAAAIVPGRLHGSTSRANLPHQARSHGHHLRPGGFKADRPSSAATRLQSRTSSPARWTANSMSEATRYTAQDRGDAAAYAAYFAGMDTTMRQKLAFVGAHFLLDPGARIADMGCGSGSGTYQLALLNPQIRVIGVDINPEAVRIASEKYRLPNLSFVVGDVADPLFADDPLDGILSSSTLHHVYTFNGYSRDAVRRALANHIRCLRENGVFVLRDFVNPARDAHVLIELDDAPSRGEAVTELADADLLGRFARTARPLDQRC